MLVVCGAAQAQVIPVVEAENKPPIELKLSSTSLMVCVGSQLPLEMELINRGPNEFKVDKFFLWNRFSYGFLGDRKAGRGGGMGSSCSHCAVEYLVLKPDKSYQSAYSFDLGMDFFKDAGKYIIKLTVEGVASNELEFELFDCE